MKMVPYVVRPGDHLARIAQRHGFDANTVWNDPANADLKKRRGEGNVLASGDILHIPGPTAPEWLSVKIGDTNVFTGTVSTITVKVRAIFDGQPCPNAPYRVECAGATIEGTTDADGGLSFDAPVTAFRAVVEIPGKPRIPVRIGHLDPVNTFSGVVQRLRHLRYLPHGGVHGDDDAPADWLSEAVPAAIASFQSASNLEPSGEMDDDTGKALVNAHGS